MTGTQRGGAGELQIQSVVAISVFGVLRLPSLAANFVFGVLRPPTVACIFPPIFPLFFCKNYGKIQEN